MLDWDTLTPEIRDTSNQVLPSEPGHSGTGLTHEPGQSVPACPGTVPAKTHFPGQARSSNSAASGASVPVVPAVPAQNQGKEQKPHEKGAGGGVAANEFAPEKHPRNPVAVLLAIAYCEHVGAGTDDMVTAIESLRTMPPGEQARMWWNACLGQGLKPWRLICLPTPGEGMECMGCSHIDLISDRVPGSRGRFHWGCKLGYMIHEVGRYTERILIAPEECQSWERWQPAR